MVTTSYFKLKIGSKIVGIRYTQLTETGEKSYTTNMTYYVNGGSADLTFKTSPITFDEFQKLCNKYNLLLANEPEQPSGITSC